MKTTLTILLTALLMMGCSSKKETEQQANSDACKALKTKVDQAFAAIKSCTQHSDCILAPAADLSNYSCKGVGYNQNQSTAQVESAIQDWLSGGCANPNQACTLDYRGTNLPCQNGKCVDADGYFN